MGLHPDLWPGLLVFPTEQSVLAAPVLFFAVFAADCLGLRGFAGQILLLFSIDLASSL